MRMGCCFSRIWNWADAVSSAFNATMPKMHWTIQQTSVKRIRTVRRLKAKNVAESPVVVYPWHVNRNRKFYLSMIAYNCERSQQCNFIRLASECWLLKQLSAGDVFDYAKIATRRIRIFKYSKFVLNILTTWFLCAEIQSLPIIWLNSNFIETFFSRIFNLYIIVMQPSKIRVKYELIINNYLSAVWSTTVVYH